MAFAFLLYLVFAVLPVFAGVHEIWWNITYVSNTNPDGLSERRVVGVNGSWPPPPISVNTSDVLLVHATNSLSEPATLHHHGMFFNSTTWMDGAMGISQCGIPPGETFDYVIPVNSSGQWGTYWVHAHSPGHYVDGLRSPLLLHPPQEAYSYDDDFTIILGDWYHQEHSVLMKEYISTDNPDGAEPTPDSGLLYFAKGNQYLPSKLGISIVGFNENATLPFQPNKSYRLRIINTSAFATFVFSIDGHDMQIIEADAVDVQEFPISALSIAAAQRYSVLVKSRSDALSNWAVHANMDTSMFDDVPDSLDPNITSSITYNDSAPLIDLGYIDSYDPVDDMSLVPLQVKAQLPPATRTIDLEATFDLMSDGTNRGMFNQITYNLPIVPTVFSELSLGENATVEAAYGPLSFVVSHLEVFDILLKNGDTDGHPFHMHGHEFQIIHRAQNYSSDDVPPLIEGQPNPIRRDTVFVPGGGSVTLRLVADNPGAWFFHCHIEWHFEAGLTAQIIEAPLVVAARQQQNHRSPGFMYDQCKALNVPSSGNAAGHQSATDLSGLPVGPFPVSSVRGLPVSQVFPVAPLATGRQWVMQEHIKSRSVTRP